MAKAVGRRGRDVIAQGPPAVKVWWAFSLGRHRHIEIPLLRQGAWRNITVVTKIALVSCVKKKQCTPMPARYLYCSDWFRKASAYAMCIADEWYILSAKYGLVEPDRVIAPYDVTLNRMSAAERRAWAVRVWDELKEKLKPGDKVVILAGIKYRERLINPIQAMGCSIEIPMAGLRIGEQLSWLKQKLLECNRA